MGQVIAWRRIIWTDHSSRYSSNSYPYSGSLTRRGLPDFPGTARRRKAATATTIGAVDALNIALPQCFDQGTRSTFSRSAEANKWT
jgi:hypothetical protein